MTSLQELHDHSSQHNSADKCLTHYTLCHILVSEQLSTSSLLILFGLESMPMLGKWAKACLQCQHSKIHCHTITPLSTFTSPDAHFDHIHIDHFHLLKDVPISSPALIDSQDGRKPSPSLTSPQRLLPVHSSLAGSPAGSLALVPPPQFPWTEDVSFSLNSGPN